MYIYVKGQSGINNQFRYFITLKSTNSTYILKNKIKLPESKHYHIIYFQLLSSLVLEPTLLKKKAVTNIQRKTRTQIHTRKKGYKE